ncbi:methylmalonyl-CoA epimerase [Halovenus rubra]|uniref:Methylmalonyl-CoA epimerase n=2 Tax=Halovenus rubra TaxID=869890 RepID=A0ABD5X866_9EURY|nr:methylmalonyl-CoA epimerase [Halovenus rubra]
MTVDHVGIATDDLDTLGNLYVDLFGCSLAHTEVFDGMDVCFLEFGNSYFELLEPSESGGTLSRYLESNGPGIHHVAVATDDIEAALETAVECGVDLIDEQPRQGAWGHDVAFMHPQSTGGILLEFVEH